MANKLTFTDGVSKNLQKLSSDKASDDWGKKASAQLLVLSRRQVPFDEGNLNRSGFNGKDSDGHFVAYNEEYAAYQHEGMRADGSHVVRRWNKIMQTKHWYGYGPIRLLKDNLA